MRIHVLLTAACALFLFIASSIVHGVSPPETHNTFAVHFIDVGQGDASFIELPGGENILIDTGSPAGGPAVVNFLKSLGVKKINHLMLTHPHDDHIGGIFSILSAFEADNYYDNGFSNFDSTMYGDYVKAVRDDLTRYHVLQAGESLAIGAAHIKVLNPLLPPTGNLNNDSLVFRFEYGETHILFAGDIGAAGEQRLLKIRADLKSNVLKAGHHGGSDATTDEFLKAVNPEAVIISVSMINRNAKPHRRVINLLMESHVPVYRTDVSGSIILTGDGHTYSISAGK